MNTLVPLDFILARRVVKNFRGYFHPYLSSYKALSLRIIGRSKDH